MMYLFNCILFKLFFSSCCLRKLLLIFLVVSLFLTHIGKNTVLHLIFTDGKWMVRSASFNI